MRLSKFYMIQTDMLFCHFSLTDKSKHKQLVELLRKDYAFNNCPIKLVYYTTGDNDPRYNDLLSKLEMKEHYESVQKSTIETNMRLIREKDCEIHEKTDKLNEMKRCLLNLKNDLAKKNALLDRYARMEKPAKPID